MELASSAFGQAMAVTPLQVCTAISAAVNGGYLVTPHVVDKITDQNGNVVQEIGTNIRRQVISESASETIRQIMEFEVGDGTQGGGGNAYVAGYRIGGKSSTAEYPDAHKLLCSGVICYLQVSLHLYHSAFLLSEFNVRSAEVICHLHYCVVIT